jgi:hypothetical protein
MNEKQMQAQAIVEKWDSQSDQIRAWSSPVQIIEADGFEEFCVLSSASDAWNTVPAEGGRIINLRYERPL